ncbi:uncharacterized protein LOC129939670 [Eupeodes corollae]|uniref:uncharacterized protein LOC129939670 n=1 Tax=Eupeodes corollae TaxID=290404 RepID=UPI00248F8C4F|nr:uncharacterized protein LOC129939670 [Eupeodes corollae]
MKFVAVLLIVAAIVAVAMAVPHHKEGHVGTSCEYDCSKPGSAVCATNGTCRKNFPSECELEKYNCVNHPEKQFEQEDDKKCSDKSVPLCAA